MKERFTRWPGPPAGMRGTLIALPTRRDRWCHELAEAFPGVEAVVETVLPFAGDRCAEILLLRGVDATKAATWVRSHRCVLSWELLAADGDGIRLKLVLPSCGLLRLAAQSRVVPLLPFRVAGGEDLWEVPAQSAEVERFLQALDAQGAPARLVRKGALPGKRPCLTEHQERVLAEAIRAGYYSSPRRIEIRRLAERLGVSKSTLSETLILIEARLLGGGRDLRGC